MWAVSCELWVVWVEPRIVLRVAYFVLPLRLVPFPLLGFFGHLTRTHCPATNRFSVFVPPIWCLPSTLYPRSLPSGEMTLPWASLVFPNSGRDCKTRNESTNGWTKVVACTSCRVWNAKKKHVKHFTNTPPFLPMYLFLLLSGSTGVIKTCSRRVSNLDTMCKLPLIEPTNL